MEKRFYDQSKEEVLSGLGTTEKGLSSAEAANRLAKNGPNKLAEGEKTSTFRKLMEALADPMIIMLLVAALIQAVVTVLESGGALKVSDFVDVFVILVVVIINAIMSLVQENKAEAAMDALMVMTAAKAKVLRDGQMIFANSEDLVVGDVLVLEAGDSVAADCRILSAHSLKAEEAAMTGESLPVLKMVDVLNCQPDREIALGDRSNMLFSGSTCVYGRGTAVVVKTGMDTEMGKIAGALSAAEKEQTPLQKKMAELSRFLTKLVIFICIVVFAVGIFENVIFTSEPFSWALLGNVSLDTFIAAIALAVAAIPEGLPAVVTIVLSIGVTAMAKRQALMRKLTAVETLGCTQIICSDKTGTLTQNRMTVVDADTPDKNFLAKAMALCSDSELPDGAEEAVGEPTENALVNYAASLNMRKPDISAKEPRVGEAPFDSERKMMSTIHKRANDYIQYTKGACDMIVERCTHYLAEGGELRPMTDVKKTEIYTHNKAYADRALRVLTCAYRTYQELPEDTAPEALETDMIYIGLLGMIDPCRPEVYEAIRQCRLAGIRPIMITGDHLDTAIAIGKDLGIIKDSSEGMVGAGLDQYSDEELVEVVTRYSVYARVQPEHKSRIVRAWQARGCVTAMTGDGVNDAPSIKAADIGIGMGITGTDVTKGVADMVLADDNFATIVNAVEEGRKIYDNVCKVIQFQLSTNMAEVLIMFFASLFNFTILTPVHLLWINMVTDSLPGLALGMEKAEGDVMKRKPRSSSDGIFSGGAGADMVWQGIYLAVVGLMSYFIGYRMANGDMAGIFGSECSLAMSMAFVTVNFTEIFCAINMRSRRKSIFSGEMLKRPNKWLLGAFVITTLVTIAAVFIPGFRSIFKIEEGLFELKHFLIALGLAATVFPVFEIGKAVQRMARKEQ